MTIFDAIQKMVEKRPAKVHCHICGSARLRAVAGEEELCVACDTCGALVSVMLLTKLDSTLDREGR